MWDEETKTLESLETNPNWFYWFCNNRSKTEYTRFIYVNIYKNPTFYDVCFTLRVLFRLSFIYKVSLLFLLANAGRAGIVTDKLIMSQYDHTCYFVEK